MRTGTYLCAILLVAALVLTGCLGMKAPLVSPPAAPALFVDYQRAGGSAGVNDRLVIFDNGVTLVSNRTTGREILLNQSDLEQISAAFDAAQFPMLEGNYSRTGADLMQYSIRYQGRTVNTEDTAIPPTLEPVIEEMNRILSNGLNSRQAYLPLPRIAT
jgi:predicted small lipoprotein YifL